MSATDKELLALAAKWRERARNFAREAHESDNVVDTHRLVGMASSLKFASDEVCFTARLNPGLPEFMVAGACFEATKTEVVCFSGETVRQGDMLDIQAVPHACAKGHPLTPENMHTNDREGRWRCRQCGRERAAAFRAGQKRAA